HGLQYIAVRGRGRECRLVLLRVLREERHSGGNERGCETGPIRFAFLGGHLTVGLIARGHDIHSRGDDLNQGARPCEWGDLVIDLRVRAGSNGLQRANGEYVVRCSESLIFSRSNLIRGGNNEHSLVAAGEIVVHERQLRTSVCWNVISRTE